MTDIYVDEKIAQYAAALVAATHADPRFAGGFPVERTPEILDGARAEARAAARRYAIPPDVKTAARELFRATLVLVPPATPRPHTAAGDDPIAALFDHVAVP